jgi:hypothetical protein
MAAWPCAIRNVSPECLLGIHNTKSSTRPKRVGGTAYSNKRRSLHLSARADLRPRGRKQERSCCSWLGASSQHPTSSVFPWHFRCRPFYSGQSPTSPQLAATITALIRPSIGPLP